MKKLFIYAGILLGLASCQEETIVSQVTGTLYQDCSGNGLPFAEVAFKTNVGGSFTEPIIIGANSTNANGNFHFTYELDENDVGTADLILTTSNGYSNLIQNLPLSKDHQLVLFIDNESRLFVNLSGTRVYSATDTLFMALSNNNDVSFVVQPQVGYIDTLKAKTPNLYQSQASGTFYYGVGKADFDKSKEALGIADSTYNHININFSGCVANDLLNLVIN